MAVAEQRTNDSNTVVTDVTNDLHTPRRELDEPTWSQHALNRYDERTPSGSVSPERAWTEGISVQYALPAFNQGCYPKEVRLYRHANCHSIMIRMDSHIVTVLLLELMNESGLRTYLHSLADLHANHQLREKSAMYGESDHRVAHLDGWEH